MAMTQDDVIRILKTHGIDERAHAYVLAAFQSPARDPASHAGTMAGHYTSQKTGFLIDLEADSESTFFFRLDRYDQDVVLMLNAPPPLDVIYHNPETGRTSRAQFKPDFLVVRTSGAPQVVERRPRSRLVKQVREKGHIYEWDPGTDTFRSPAREAAAEKLGLKYIISVPTLEDELLTENLSFLHPYFDARFAELKAETQSLLDHLFADTPWRSLQSIIDEGYVGRIAEIYAAIAHEHVVSTLNRIPIRETGQFLIFADKHEALLYAEQAELTPPIYRLKTQWRPKLGEELTFDGAKSRVVDTTGSMIEILDEANNLHRLSPAAFERYEVEGKIVRPEAKARQEGWQYLSGYAFTAPKDLERGLQRKAMLSRIYSGEASAADFNLSEEYVRQLMNIDKRAQMAGQAPALALATRHAQKGNRNAKVDAQALALAAQAFEVHYDAKISRSVSAAYGKYTGMCKAKSVVPISQRAFYDLKNRRRREERSDEKRGGRGAAYADKSFADDCGYTATRLGSRPFEIAHMDSTPVDTECVDSRSGEAIGVPWLTILFDAYTKSVPAFVLLYERPSYRTVMLLIRDCIRRHGYAPTIIRSDRAGEFKGRYARDVISKVVAHRQWRPPREPRFGSFLERYFGTAAKELFHNLPGNTKAMRNPRSVTKGFRPQDHAALTLADLYYQFEEFSMDVYANRPHEFLDKSPRQAMEDGMALAGFHSLPKIAYDENLILATCPPFEHGGTRVYDPPRGVKHAGVRYANPHVDRAIREKTRVTGVYDPFDLSHVYVWVPAVREWRECVNKRHRHQLAFRTETELACVSDEYRKQHPQYAKGREISATITAHLLEKMALDPKHQQFRAQQLETISLLGNIGLLGPTFNTGVEELRQGFAAEGDTVEDGHGDDEDPELNAIDGAVNDTPDEAEADAETDDVFKPLR